MKPFFVSLFFLLLLNRSVSQTNPAIDELRQSLSRAIEQKDKVDILNKIAAIALTDSAVFFKYSNEALQLAAAYPIGLAGTHANRANYFLLHNHYSEALIENRFALNIYVTERNELEAGNMLTAIGKLFNLWGKNDSSIVAFEKATSVFRKLNAQKELAASLNSYGVALADKGLREKAVSNYVEALKISEGISDKYTIANVCNNLGKFMMEAKNYKEARDYLNKSIDFADWCKDNALKAKALLNLGNVYINESGYDTGILYLKKADSVFALAGLKRGNQAVNNNLGAVYLRQKKYAEALPFFKKALQFAEESGSFSGMALIEQNIGYAYTCLKEYLPAKEWLQKAEQSAVKFSDKYTIGEIYKHRSSYDSAVGNFESAFFYKVKAEAISDSLLNEKLGSQIAGLQVQYETAKKEQQIQEQQFALTRQKYWTAGIVALLILGGLLGYSYYRRYKLKQEARLQHEIMRQQNMATQAIIEAEERERKRIAGDLHDGVGQMMSAAKMNLSGFESRLHFSDENEKIAFGKIIALVDESCKEVRTVSHNMMPNALLKSGLSNAVKEFIDKIDNKVLKVNLYAEGLNDRLDTNIETVLYRVIQECVNNVIKHSGANELDISLIKDADGISATIEDNGRGFDTRQKDKFEGIGLKNIKTRIEFLKGTVDFDSAYGKGTLVAIHVPL